MGDKTDRKIDIQVVTAVVKAAETVNAMVALLIGPYGRDEQGKGVIDAALTVAEALNGLAKQLIQVANARLDAYGAQQ